MRRINLRNLAVGLVMLAGCDQPPADTPTERERCVEYLACFDECLWTQPEQVPGYPPTPGPLPAACRGSCDVELDGPLSLDAADSVESHEHASWSLWSQMTADTCASDDQECLDYRLGKLEDLLVTYENAKRMRAGICAYTEDE